MNRKKLFAGLVGGLLILSFILFWPYQPQRNAVHRLQMNISDETYFPSLQVSVGGTTFDAKLDLGAKYTQIKSTSLGNERIKRLTRFFKAVGLYSEEIYELCQLDCLKLGDLYLYQIDFLDSKNRENFALFNVKEGKTTQDNEPVPDIILGNSIFLDKVFLLDYPNAIFWVGDTAEDLYKNFLLDETFHKGPLSYKHQHFLIEAIHEDELKNFIIDTGSTWNFLAAAENCDDSFQMTNPKEDFIVFNGQKLELGKTCDINRSFDGIDGVLGASFLSIHLVALDPKNGTIWIKPLASANAPGSEIGSNKKS